jgi:DNA ligase-1
MNSDEIFKVIEDIAVNPSKLVKQELVKHGCSHEQFKRVLVAALDPLVTYGMKQLPPRVQENGTEVFNDDTWNLLTDLAARKVTGNDAKARVADEFNRLSENSAELLARIITKDLRAGFGDSTVNKVCKGLIRDYPYMRCSLPKDAKLDKWTWKEGVYSQEKADGQFANIDHDLDGSVRITSRQGTQYPLEQFGPLIADIQTSVPRGVQLHGELLVCTEGFPNVPLDREISNGMLNAVAQGGSLPPFDEQDGTHYTINYFVWDVIPLTEVKPKNKYSVAYAKRYETLVQCLPDDATAPQHLRLIETRIVHSLPDAYVHYRDMLQKGKEGTVIKNGTAEWKDGTSKDQVKLKLKFQVDLEVVDFNEGTGKYAGQLGSLVCRTSDGELEVNVSGRGDKMRAEVWANREDWRGAIITGEANAIMPATRSEKHSLFLPIFIERRLDKKVADTLQRVQEQFDAAVAAA